MKMEYFQSQVCVCAASTNLTCAKGRAEMGAKMKNRNAYFTVEAALVFPVVTGTILFVIYSMLFQYDRCILEQDMGAMALWGSLEEDRDTAALEEKVQRRMAELYRDKYVTWRFTAMNASLDKNYFSVQGAGEFTIPLKGWNFPGIGEVWGAKADYGYSRLAPVAFIRLCHKFRNLIER